MPNDLYDRKNSIKVKIPFLKVVFYAHILYMIEQPQFSIFFRRSIHGNKVFDEWVSHVSRDSLASTTLIQIAKNVCSNDTISKRKAVWKYQVSTSTSGDDIITIRRKEAAFIQLTSRFNFCDKVNWHHCGHKQRRSSTLKCLEEVWWWRWQKGHWFLKGEICSRRNPSKTFSTIRTATKPVKSVRITPNACGSEGRN